MNTKKTNASSLDKMYSEFKRVKLKEIIDDFIVPIRDKPKVFDGSIPWCRIEDIEGKYLNDSLSSSYVSEEVINSMNLKVHPKGTVICSCSARLGVCAILTRKIVTNQTFIGLVPGKNIDKEFLYYCMTFNENKLQSLSSGTTISYLSRKEFENFEIEIPCLNEQEKIAEILSTWDSAIEKQEQLIEKKKEFKRGLMQRLLSGEVRFKSEIGEEYPDWKLVELGDYLIKHNEKSEYNGQYPVLTSSRKGIFLQSEYYSGNDVASDDTTGYNVVPRGYFTYRHMSDDLIFKFNINDIVDKGIVSTLYPVFTVKDMDPYFLRTKLNEGNEFKRFALSQKQGGSRTYMYFSKLEKLKVNIPSLEEQKKISEVLKTADKEIELLEKELEALKLQKKGLMQRLLTGEVRVNVE